MQKLSMLVFLCTILTFSLQAQTYTAGTNTISLGVGLGSSIAGGYTYGSQTPGVNAHYDRGIWEAGPGVVSLGAYVGIKGYKYSYNDGLGDNITEKWNYTIVGVRGAYHFTGLHVDNLDLYAGAMLSYNHLSYSYNGTGGGGSYGSDLYLTGFAGAQYFFAGSLAAFAELGYGVSILDIGLSYKF